MLAAVSLTLGVFSQPSFARGRAWVVPPDHPAWVVAEGYSGYSGYPWAGPGWAWPLNSPKVGCYEFRQHLKGAWRQVVVCE